MTDLVSCMQGLGGIFLLSAVMAPLAWGSATAPDLSGSVKADVASAYRSSSNGLLDTRPVASQTLDWHLGLGDFGFLAGYFWAISSLHDMQHEQHRPLFYDVETSVRYGYSIALAERAMLSTSAGPYIDLPFGYRNAHMKCWGPYVVQRLDNPWLTPYWSGLWIVETGRRGRVCFGLEKKFALSEKLSLVPFAEVVWMDRRRFRRRYGDEPEHGIARGGAFAYSFVGVNAKWALGENFSILLMAAMCDVVNSQARQSVRRSHAYYARNDWPVFKIGIEYRF